jgi:5-oxopent-3-ene-1,2,5-tricarboxylate decarboxylase/2-hydroxyhepta-2,4-diene-1,7-dioate isomerase
MSTSPGSSVMNSVTSASRCATLRIRWPVVVPRAAIADPDDLAVQVYVDGDLKQQTTTGQRLRNVARLLADVTEFMTLLPGDVLMLGASAGAPRVRAGQQSRIVIDGVGELVNHFAHEGHTA